MMPLVFSAIGEEGIIKKIGGRQEVKAHLENLGFVVGGTVRVISTWAAMSLSVSRTPELQSVRKWRRKL